MNWFYANAGQQAGPINDEEFNRLIGEGVIQPSTLVWSEGMAGWEPLAKVRPGEAPPPGMPDAGGGPPSAAPGGRCSNCGGTFPVDNLMLIEGAMVCPNCKPLILHRIKEGAGALHSPVDPDGLVRRVTDTGRTVDVGRCLSRAWSVMKANMGPLIGVTLLVMLAMMAGGVVPFIGSCISLVISGPLMGGLYWYLLKQVRGEGSTVGDAFSGFSKNFGQLFLGYLIPALLAYLPLLPFGVLFLIRNMDNRGRGPQFGAPEVVTLVLGVLGLIYFALAWMYTLPLIMDKRLTFWQAMGVSRRVVNQRFGPLLLLMLLSMALGLAGLLAFCVGLILAIPLIFTMSMCAYDDLFGDAEDQAAAPTVSHG